MLNSGHHIAPITTPEQKLMIKTEPAISIVVPIYNEEENVEGLVEDIIETMENCGLSFEILAVNDGSKDGTLDILKSLLKKYPKFLRVASHVVNKGNGASLRTGIRHARGDIVVTMDADGQHTPKDILELVSYIPPFDMVVASRTKSYQGKFHRNLANRIYNGLASWLTRTEILDLTSGFRAMRRKAVSHFLHLYPSGFSAPTTITMALLKAGYNVKFIPIDVKPRAKGKSKINLFRDGGRFITIILKVIMLYDPLRIFMPATFAMLLLGIITMIFGIIVAQRLVVPGSSVVLFMASLTIFLLGLVSSQISNATIFYFGDESLMIYEEHSEQ